MARFYRKVNLFFSSLFLFTIFTFLSYFTPLNKQYERKLTEKKKIPREVRGGMFESEKNSIIVFVLVTKVTFS